MYVVTVEFAVRPEHAQAFVEAIVANATTSRGCEPGCRRFDVCVSPAERSNVFLYELYADRAAFDAHLASAHFRAFDLVSAPWIVRKTVRTFERVDPLAG